MKASVLAELLQQYPNATVMHVEHYAQDETAAHQVHKYHVFLTGEEVEFLTYFDEHDKFFVDGDGKANRDLIVLL